MGIIIDENGDKIENVLVTVGNTTTLTDRNGMFIVSNAQVFENFAYIKAQKDGYLNGSRVVIPKTNGTNKISITLIKREIRQRIQSGIVSEVSLGTTKVRFSSDFIIADGSPYVGPVDVLLHYVRPYALATFTEASGNFLAQKASNEARALETYGMISVNLFSPSGEELNINSNSPATIEFPVDVSQTSIAPETINLWYFDEAQGYWKEEGQATKEGNKYVAEVSHFTWWNYDIPFDAINFCFSINPSHSDTTIPYYVIIKRASNDQIIYAGDIFACETECGLVPRNEEILVSIDSQSDSCDQQLVDSETLGGYATDTTVEISFTEEVTTTSITEIATNCDGEPITNGYIYINDADTFSITDGTIDIVYTSCSVDVVSIEVLDFNTSLWTVVQSVTEEGANIKLGTVSTCESNGGIYYGDVTLETQQEINDFEVYGFAEIDGNLTIGPELHTNSIIDLSTLASLEIIIGTLNIQRNSHLPSLAGLDNITYVQVLRVVDNEQLVSLTGLESLTTIIVSVIIEDNNNLTSLAGLENVTQLDFLRVRSNDSLTSLSGVNSVTELIILEIDANPQLIDLTGLEQITTLSTLWILNNDALVSLDGLQNLNLILESAFQPEVAVGITPYCDTNKPAPDPNLVDLCAVRNDFLNSSTKNTQINIAIGNNGYNP